MNLERSLLRAARHASLVFAVVLSACTQANRAHCGNNSGDATCEIRDETRPYCSLCTAMNDGCGDTPASDACAATTVSGSSVDSSASVTTGSASTASSSAAADSASSGGGRCGNGEIDPGELCDGDDVGALDCAAVQLGTGPLACLPDCMGYDVDGCSVDAVCGNMMVEGNEPCDGEDLDRTTCSDLDGFIGGSLSCNDCAFDTTMCGECLEAGDPCESDDECCRGLQCGLLGLTKECSRI